MVSPAQFSRLLHVSVALTSLLILCGCSPAVNLTKARAEAGDADAQYNLGLMYASGQGVTQDYTEALKWWCKAAEQGDAMAQSSLGRMYLRGKGVVQDYAKAHKWYRKAAEQGDANAQVGLGMTYVQGQGVTQDCTEVAKWFRKAAEQGSAKAQSNFGVMYAKGQGVTQNYTEALVWFRKAAEQGHAKAQNIIAWLLATCPDDTIRDGWQAIKYAEQAVSQEETANVLDTLAAAYAEAGQFEDAITAQEKAIAKLEKDDPLRIELQPHLESYRSGKPWREE